MTNRIGNRKRMKQSRRSISFLSSDWSFKCSFQSTRHNRRSQDFLPIFLFLNQTQIHSLSFSFANKPLKLSHLFGTSYANRIYQTYLPTNKLFPNSSNKFSTPNFTEYCAWRMSIALKKHFVHLMNTFCEICIMTNQIRPI